MKNVLLTGASGTLGKHIYESGLFGKILAPTHAELDITNLSSVKKFFEKNDFNIIIHCAAIARMRECENNPELAITTNTIGTANLVMASIESKKKIRFIHISTDGVYESTNGNYTEDGPAIPYNNYGWTKLGAETAVNTLENFCIIRTGFFDPKNIRFEDAATDAYSSRLPINELIVAIAKLAESKFIGTINVGGDRKSEFERLKEYKPGLRPTKISEIMKTVPFRIATDASMDSTKWKKELKS
jgi:dTDP-4-dehydrorhamnose reductase